MIVFRFDVGSRSTGFDNSCIVLVKDVILAIERLKYGKNDGDIGLTSDRIKYNCLEISGHIAMLITGVLIHGTALNDFLISTVIPIPKGK